MIRHLLGFSLLLLITTVQAQTISTDRPTQAYGTATMPKGYFQIETGLGVDIFDGATGFSLGTTQFRYGVAKNFELRMSAGVGMLDDWYSQQNTWNSTIGMGLKGRIVEGDKINFSYILEASIPLSPTHVSAWNAFLLDHSVAEKVSFAYMLYYGYNFDNLANNVADYGNAQFCYLINCQLLDKLSFFTEICASMDLINPKRITLLFDAGMTYLVRDNLQLDVFFGTGIRYTRGLFGAGISWMPKKKQETLPVE